jgi:predicted methyltransferase
MQLGRAGPSQARKDADLIAARAASQRPPTKQELRAKLRAHEGMSGGAAMRRPHTADTSLGLTDTEEMMRLRNASVAARLRPNTAEGGKKTAKSGAHLEAAHSADAVRNAFPSTALSCRRSAPLLRPRTVY